MRGLLLVCLASVALASGFHLDIPVRPVFGYHENYGIPLAKKIQEDEEAYLKAAENGGRIVGGAVAPAGQYPYLGGLIVTIPNMPRSVCGSTLLTANRLVTAAHCWFDGAHQAQQIQVVLDSQFLFTGQGVRMVAQQVVMHPEWNTQTLANDIAMIYLPQDVQFTANIQPASLPDGALLSETFVGSWGQAAGYGRLNDRDGLTTNTQVNHVALQIISVPDCAAYYTANFVRDTNICTSGNGGVGICTGDSGGPLTIRDQDRDILIGVTSFMSTNGCEFGQPSVFTRVTSFIPWIQSHLA
ncbi:trypsin domain-containing protein [Phthorimaea operculella]|nr:trypsin domain-containing protein [Phthorimaea operculella]